MGNVTRSKSNNITSPNGNSLAVFVDGESGVMQVKDVRGNVQNIKDFIPIPTPEQTGETGQVAFFNGTTTQTGDNNLYWDNVNKRLKIGTVLPQARLEVMAQGALPTDIIFRTMDSTNTKKFLVSNGAGDVYNNGAQGQITNTFFGENVGRITIGKGNSFFGANTAQSNRIGAYNSFFSGDSGGSNVVGSYNSYFGYQAGAFNQIGQGLTNANNSVFLGVNTRANADNQTNQIVIGHDAVGAGSNTATLGNTAIIDTVLRGRINLTQYKTGSRPSYVKGALIYDSTLGKLVVGGNTDWEVVTSI